MTDPYTSLLMENNHQFNQQNPKRPHVIFFPFPLQGHINPMLQLASILYHKANFSVTIIHTNFNSPNPSNYPHDFNFVSIPDNLSESETSSDDVVALLTLLNLKCFTPFQDCLTDLLSKNSSDAACLITDAVWHFAQGVADELQIPRIVLRTSSVSSFIGFAAIDAMAQKGLFPVHGICYTYTSTFSSPFSRINLTFYLLAMFFRF